MPTAITEKGVMAIWQDWLRDRKDLKTAADEPVTIVYPGRRNDDRGADFKDAVIATGKGRLKGDIEIHVKTSDWFMHRHHRDPAYNRVILHVVYRNDSGKAIVLENGAEVPTVALDNFVRNDAARAILPPLPCRRAGCRDNAILIARRLDAAGEARFLTQAARFQTMRAQEGAGQALYRGLMTALGYVKNKEAMAALARRVTLARLETAAHESIADIEYLAQCQARLTGAAGLLPSQRAGSSSTDEPAGDWEARLGNIWAVGGGTAHMPATEWRFFKVRPGNSPVRRIAAMSYLLLRYRERGLLAGLEGIFNESATGKEASSLEHALVVMPDGYWGCYLDFGIPARGIVPALLGRERAVDIVINVLLPFLSIREQSKQAEKALKIYRDYRATAENTLVKHMRQQLGLTRHLTDTARRQQGLIHIYKTLCAEGKCDECPIGEINM